MPSNHGGARAGAGRKPKAPRYSEKAAAIEQMIVDALPAIVDKMIDTAMHGDLKAARYLIDRILGRVPRCSPPSVGASYRETHEPEEGACDGDLTNSPSNPSPPTIITLEELREAAFGAKPTQTLEIIKLNVPRPIDTRQASQPCGRLTFATARQT